MNRLEILLHHEDQVIRDKNKKKKKNMNSSSDRMEDLMDKAAKFLAKKKERRDALSPVKDKRRKESPLPGKGGPSYGTT